MVGPRGVHWPPASTSSGWTLHPLAGPRRLSGSVASSGLFSLQLQVGVAAYCHGPLCTSGGPQWDCMPCVLRPILVDRGHRPAVCAWSLSLLWLLLLAVRSRLSPRSVAAGPAGAGTGAGGTRCEGLLAPFALFVLTPACAVLLSWVWGPVTLPLRWLLAHNASLLRPPVFDIRRNKFARRLCCLGFRVRPSDCCCVPCVAPACGYPCDRSRCLALGLHVLLGPRSR
jgi:hypothetical protein